MVGRYTTGTDEKEDGILVSNAAAAERQQTRQLKVLYSRAILQAFAFREGLDTDFPFPNRILIVVPSVSVLIAASSFVFFFSSMVRNNHNRNRNHHQPKGKQYF